MRPRLFETLLPGFIRQGELAVVGRQRDWPLAHQFAFSRRNGCVSSTPLAS